MIMCEDVFILMIVMRDSAVILQRKMNYNSFTLRGLKVILVYGGVLGSIQWKREPASVSTTEGGKFPRKLWLYVVGGITK